MARREKTLDPHIDIIERGEIDGIPFVKYESEDAETGERRQWIVSGQCNRCGLCVIGVANAEDYEWSDLPGRPFSVLDRRVAGGRPGHPRPPRKDEPVAPGFNEAMRRQAKETRSAMVDGCSLDVGDYL